MPHAFIIAAAVTAGVGAAIAFEVNVFKPWREEHWTEGWADGIKQEWEEFTENVRENFNEISGDRRSRGSHFDGRSHPHNDNSFQRRRRSSDQQEEMELRREMNEFSQHEAQVSGVKARYADEFDQAQGSARLRKGRDVMESSAMEDRLLDAPSLGYHSSSYRSHDENQILKRTGGQSSSHSAAQPPTSPPFLDNEQYASFVTSSNSSHEDAHSAWHSPGSASQTHTEDNGNGTISADWQSHFSPSDTPLRIAASDAGEDETGSWTQLTDSRSASPSWSEAELTQAR